MMETASPIGPLTPEEWQEAIDAPYGRAGEILRRHDPAWGLTNPETAPRKWHVKFTREVTLVAYGTVTATTRKEAEALADQMVDDDKLDWGDDGDGFVYVASVEEDR